jgi:hypothetical protein
VLYRVLTILLAGLASITAACAEPKKDASTVDVLGLRLGMTANQVAATTASLPNVTIAPRQGTLTSGPYTTPNLIFSEEISQGPDAHIGNQPDLEYLYVIFSMKPGNPVIYIDRQTNFSQAKAPSIQSLADLIKAKYGMPDAYKSAAGYNPAKLIYTYNSSVRYTEFGLPSMTCANGLSMAAGTAATIASGDFDQNQEGTRFASIKNCGVWMIVTISPNSTNGQLADRFEVQLGDLPGMADSIDYMLNNLAANAASTAASQAKNAAANAPKL